MNVEVCANKRSLNPCFSLVGMSSVHYVCWCALQPLTRLWSEVLGVEKIGSYQSKVRIRYTKMLSSVKSLEVDVERGAKLGTYVLACMRSS